MKRRHIVHILVAIVFIAVITVGFMVRYLPSGVLPRLLPELDPLPSLEGEPGYNLISVEKDNVTLSTLVQFYIFRPHNGYNTFEFHLEINVTNEGPTNIDDFHASKASVFFSNSTLLYTFGLIPSSNETIEAGEANSFEYEEDRDMPLVLGNLELEEFYLRVLVTFNTDSAVILTTPLTQILVAIE